MDITDANVTAATLTYNRLELLFENYEAVVRGSVLPTTYVICDNASDPHTSDGIFDRLIELGWEVEGVSSRTIRVGKSVYTAKLTEMICSRYEGCSLQVINLPENVGSAGGYAAIFNYVASTEAEFLWVMDDDGYPASDCLEVMSRHLSELPGSYAAVTPLTYCADYQGEIFAPWSGLNAELVSQKPSGDLENKLSPFNGSLYRVDAIREIGAPDPRYYIWGDEDDYRFRVLAKFKTRCVLDAIYFHPRLHKYEDYMFGKYSLAPPGRIYYSLRNHTFFSLHNGYSTPFIRMFIKQQFVTIFFRRNYRFRSLCLNFLALYHGAIGDFSNKVDGSK